MDPSPHRGSPPHPPSANQNNDSSNNDQHQHQHQHQNQHRVRFAEGEPQASYKISQPTPKRDNPATGKSSTAQPAVYWDDRDNEANFEAYTFYREGTPTPPEYETPEKRSGHEGGGLAPPVAESSTIGGGTIGSDRDFGLGSHNNQGHASNWSLADSNDMSRATKKRVLWIIIAVGVLILIGVGVGVGLGVGLAKGKGPAAEPVEGPSSSLPTQIPGSSPTPTDPPATTPGGTGAAAETTTGSAANPRPTYNSDCPALNNTVYHVPGSTQSFLRLCGVDYSGSGATDLAHAYTESMADCMHTCASFDQCTACAWGYIKGDQGGKHRCYMKKDLKQGHEAASDWCFAVLQ
ncbi:hypothetical protein C8A00DRAFT_17445 [Chaetomidium leptoderma]|uniref:Apple domain-containing protein n=1 Tax=Chaetomidium leptoderma TaxID=669021 RepID=A0AAN6VGX0_9PEZI|nr:hypothetical protein C8A00DRAFT_17445 [Chaetomidium leptoderma]